LKNGWDGREVEPTILVLAPSFQSGGFNHSSTATPFHIVVGAWNPTSFARKRMCAVLYGGAKWMCYNTEMKGCQQRGGRRVRHSNKVQAE